MTRNETILNTKKKEKRKFMLGKKTLTCIFRFFFLIALIFTTCFPFQYLVKPINLISLMILNHAKIERANYLRELPC